MRRHRGSSTARNGAGIRGNSCYFRTGCCWTATQERCRDKRRHVVAVGDDDLMSLRLSTSQLPGPDRVEAFREMFGRRILRIEMEPLDGEELAADMTLR